MKDRIIVAVFIINSLYLLSFSEKTTEGIYTAHSLGASFNPIGVLVDSKLHYRLPLFKKDGILWESTKIEIGLQNEWTPADNLFSIRLAIEPVALFDMEAKAGFYGMYDVFGYGYFPLLSGESSYTPEAQKKFDPKNAVGYWLSFSPTLKIKLGNLIALNTITFNSISINQEGYFLEVRTYLPHQSTEIDVINKAFLLYEYSEQWLGGIHYYIAYVNGTRKRSDRISGLFIYQPHKAAAGLFAALQVGAYVNDPLYLNKIYIAGQVGTDFRISSSSARGSYEIKSN